MIKVGEAIQSFSKLAEVKASLLRQNPVGFWLGALFAGAYVGIGIILIFSVGQPLEASLRPLVMGASFGIALILVVFAGAELFTGYTMYMSIGLLRGRIRIPDLVRTWGVTWTGNLIGSAAVASLFVLGGGGHVLKPGATLIFDIAAYKMNSEPLSLLARAILCNWLVCLAVWTSARATSDSAKCILIFWCLFAFIASGFEHSVANMTLFIVALLGNHPETVTWSGMWHNLVWVTLGNTISGAIFMGWGYVQVSSVEPASKPDDVARATRLPD